MRKRVFFAGGLLLAVLAALAVSYIHAEELLTLYRRAASRFLGNAPPACSTMALSARLDSRRTDAEPAQPPPEALQYLDPDYRFSTSDLQRYRDDIRAAIDASRHGQPAIIVDKSLYTLYLYEHGTLAASFGVEFGTNPVDDKYMEGDCCTPEGRYRISTVKDVGQTSFYRAYLLDYPNARDLERFRKLREAGQLPADASPGSLIEIHGKGTGLGRRGVNWTLGCVALSNSAMDELFARDIPAGAPVIIVRYGMALHES